MSATTIQKQAKGFIIMGPEMKRSNSVLQAIDALYYLPTNFRLVFEGHPKDQSFYNEVADLVDRFELNDRVRFMYEVDEPNAVIADDNTGYSNKSIQGESPEELASAILHASRA